MYTTCLSAYEKMPKKQTQIVGSYENNQKAEKAKIKKRNFTQFSTQFEAQSKRYSIGSATRIKPVHSISFK